MSPVEWLAFFAACLPCLQFVFFAPYPPDPLPRRGRGSPRLFHARGFAPCIPGAEPGRHRSRGVSRAGGGAAPPCLRALPPPSLAGGRGREVSQRRGLAGGKEGKLPPCSRALQKNFQKPLTEAAQYDIIAKRCQDSGKGHGGVAQLARATGSYPVGHRFKSGLRYHIGQGSAVPYPSGTALVRGFPPGPLVKRPKTPPFHGGNSSSNLLRVTK